MTLLELSGEYRASAAALRERVLLLEHRLRGADGDGRRLLEGRIRLLRAMGREARELAVLCERYYERGYCRNGKYTLGGAGPTPPTWRYTPAPWPPITPPSSAG